MAAGTAIVVVQSTHSVEEKVPSQVSELIIDLPTEAIFYGRTDPAGEAVLNEQGRKLLVHLIACAGRSVRNAGCQRKK
jgi:hypothetical protein